jgi:hypothetical protein
LEAKLQNLADEIDRRVKGDPFGNFPDVRRLPPFTRGGYKRIGWFPKQEAPAQANFWYFLWFAYEHQREWTDWRQKEGEAEILVFAGMWTRQKLEPLRDAIRKTCGPLLGSGFELLQHKNVPALSIYVDVP